MLALNVVFNKEAKMKMENFLRIIIDISEKFENCKENQTSALHYETLHMSLAVCLREITEE